MRSLKAFFRYSAAVLLLLFSTSARAVEIHTLIDGACRSLSGVVVSVTEEQVLLIDLSGHAQTWPRENVHSIVLHKTVDNPIPRLVLDEELERHLYNIYLVDSDDLAFTGWAVGFIEELIVFYDLYGRTHVLALEDIDRMLVPAPAGTAYPAHTKIALHFPGDYLECTNLANQAGLPPARIIGDRVKVGDYFDTFEERYLDLESFRERTFLYAKPFLYDERTRLGLLYMRRRGPLVPVYIHWSTGRPHAFQSFLLLGSSPVPWLPTVDPNFVLWSDLKSHIFHATFIANPFAIPAGTPTLVNSVLSPRTDANFHTESSFNYLIMMGADYGPWSASVGTFYPTRYFRVLPRSQEVTATHAGLVLRARAVWDQLSLRALYFRARQKEKNGDGLELENEFFLLGGGPSPTGMPGAPADDEAAFDPNQAAYELNEDTLRAGATLEAFDTELSGDLVVKRGEYVEDPSVRFKFRHYQLGVTVSREFGHYVRMNLHTNYHIETNDTVDDVGTKIDGTRRELDYGGAFEFQF